MQDNSEFIFEFIKSCNNDGKFSAEEICNQALGKIAELDDLFKERIKLSGVLRYFNYKKRTQMEIPKVEAFSFDYIDKSVALPILNNLKENTKFSMQDLLLTLSEKTGAQKKSCFLALKQLVEGNVLVREFDGNYVRGNKYSSFVENEQAKIH